MSSITFKDLLGAHPISDVPMAHQQNLQELLKRVNPVLEAFGAQSYIVTSGYRSEQDNLRIYSNINAKRAAAGKLPVPVATNSSHLVGMAVDIYDDGLHLTDWLLNDRIGCTMLQKYDLYAEAGNSNWLHLTTRPPKSGHRWFYP